MKIIYYFLYYAFAARLPSYDRWKCFGRMATVVRRMICRKLFRETNGAFSVGRGVDFGYLGHHIFLNDHANLGNYLKIKGNGNLHVGKHVLMGDDVIINTQDHKYLKPEGYDEFVTGNVSIGDYVWVGDRVIILRGVNIGEHSILGAGSVVTRDIPSHSVVAGNPARVIKSRKE